MCGAHKQKKNTYKVNISQNKTFIYKQNKQNKNS